MATYYVRPDGSDSNTGLGSTTALAWRTVQKALGATGIGSGDTLYIAPGTYTENITVGGTYSATTSIIGDVLCTQFNGVTPGFVKISNYSNENTAPANTNNLLDATSKAFLSFDSIYFQGGGGGNNNIVNCVTCNNFTWTRCIFQQNINYAGVNGSSFYWTTTAATASNLKIRKCVFVGHTFTPWINGVNVTDTFEMSDCLVIGNNLSLIRNIQGLVINCTFYRTALSASIGNASFPLKIRNTIVANVAGTGITGPGTAYIDDDYNRVIGCQVAYSGVTQGLNSKTVGTYGLSMGFESIVGLNSIMVLAPEQLSPNVNSGTNTDAPASDIYGATWTSGNRDIGNATFRSISGTGFYIPTERNASTITIAPGSTSQSIELYLGATGLTASTSGLSARYNRTRTASVSIPLVARTIAQAWTAGGFAEVDATNMPGVYRLDLPDAALAAGADDVTVVVRGASGTNGAVMTIKLSSGGLTSAQTASAVWGASPAGYNDATTFGGVVNQIDATVTGTSVLVQDIPSNVWQEQTGDHTTHGTYGYNILRADAPSKEGLVTLHQSGGISRIDADVHAIVNDTAAAAELKGALLHTGGDYISADLLTPVTSAQTVRIGPFAVRTDAGGADGALDLNQSTAGAVVVQLTDAQGTGIDQTSATVQAKVYNVAGGLVATYTCTPAYAVNGFVSIPMTTAVTGTAGSYIINLWSTVGATVIIYGPLQLRVRAI